MYRCLATGPIGVKVTFAEACRLAVRYGFQGISIGAPAIDEFGLEGVRALLDAHGLVAGNAGMPVNSVADQTTFDAEIEALPAYCEQMAALGCARLATWIKPWDDQLNYDQQFDRLAERSKRICDVIAPFGMRYGLEFIGPATMRAGKAHPFIHDVDGLLDLLDAVGADNLGFLLDAWHWFTAGGTAQDLAKLDDAKVVLVHANDAPTGIPLDEQMDNVRAMPGETGVIPMDVFMGALVQMGYTGPVIVEPFCQWVRELKPADAVAATAKSLDAIWP